MFIVLEGVDGSGKSTLVKRLAESKGLIYTREPTFSSEEADRLNLSGLDSIGREVEFLLDRVKHQEMLRQVHGHIVCDRYIWSGLAYCKFYSPDLYDFAVALYTHRFFVHPEFYVLVDTPIDVCVKRGKAQSKGHLEGLREAYIQASSIVSKNSKIISVEGVGNIDDVVDDIWARVNADES